MNGKKARMLRSLAGTSSSKGLKQQYVVKKGTERLHPHFDVSFTPEGQMVRELIGQFKTFSVVMDSGPRVVYKALKKRYLTAMRG